MAFPCLSFCALFLYFGLTCCSARDTITFDKPINSSEGPLVSAGEKFALGFFTPMPNNGTSHGKRYLGIWYHDGLAEPRTVVWVANRDDPLSNSTTWLFGIGDDGNLMLKSDTTTSNRPKKLTNLTGISSPSTRTLKLLDSGNLVLSEAGVDNVSSTMVVWESFLFPTDTFLPGMKMSNNLVLTSWRSQLDPAPGAFVFQQDGERQDQYIITNNELPYWKSGLSEKSLINDEIPPLLSIMLLNTRKSKNGKDCLIVNSTDSKNCNDTLIQSDNYNNTRLVMGLDGKLRFFTRDDPPWSLKWSEPRDRCGKYDACGKFGSCNDDNKVPCKCLPGFSPQSPDNWKNGNFFEGCVRQSSVCDKKKLGNGFLKLRVMKVQKPIFEFGVNNGSECRDKCLGTCKCQAYSYDEGATYLRGRASNCSCRIWIDDLNIIQESSRDGGLDIYLPMNLSEIGSRACGTCGSEIIPYPLSTGSTCGDPMYNGFSCSDTGQISFNASGQTYLVSRIDQEKQRFSIQVEKCRSGDPMEKLLHLPRSSPFVLNSKCQATKDNFDDKWFYEVEFGWNSPLEPTCSSSRDCKDWPNSSCNGAADGKKRCTCSSPFKWDPTKAGCTLASTLNQRSGPSDEKKPLYLILLAVTTTMLFILCAAFAWNVHKRRRRMLNARGNMELSLYNSERRVMDFINSDNFKEDDKKDIDVPYFNLETILIATDNFAEANKLGQGGFGPVYKGKLPRGQEIAIKRLSRGSGQGLEEFKNEVILIAKLQHRNLVRLVGYCVKGYEKMLIYEYMPNKSLDSFLFDRTRGVLLDWEKRIDIIFGIARGLLYLHQDSRLRIIHRDLKTSNILLDDEMKPKISDFGLARIFGGKQIEASTERVVGTYGYMSPEYALDGFFSIKSDVFSFGVVLLETISGKRNTGFYQAEQPLSLLGYAWRLWKDGRSLDLAEQSLRQSCNENEYVRCVNVGLLCVQEDPSERPTMSNVLFMLGSETPSLPIPKQPAYVARRSLSGSASSSSQPQYGSELSTTTLEDSQ